MLVEIGDFVGFALLDIANNTVFIIITGPSAKEINDELDLNLKKTATILDVFLCNSRNFILRSTSFTDNKLR